jgi:hypothetical protein
MQMDRCVNRQDALGRERAPVTWGASSRLLRPMPCAPVLASWRTWHRWVSRAPSATTLLTRSSLSVSGRRGSRPRSPGMAGQASFGASARRLEVTHGHTCSLSSPIRCTASAVEAAPHFRQQRFAKDGAIVLRGISSAEAASEGVAQLLAYEQSLGHKVHGNFRFNTHLLLRTLWQTCWVQTCFCGAATG